ncbi:transporter substrate-binding domain-containing protein [Kiloniella laminariae]|uniref:Transporter substrate-binding domain-containing protein n=1 Tax=Kiloniella laminariae TaxID=454162 RepID=A0ABT4LFI9_9PROT|nr:transporter substrate-binding domain-containing protein [Kiloniella laminariae]MCZ4279869.1 transporter substrate-binding domain-containing protein [Kiloniella laminariae]
MVNIFWLRRACILFLSIVGFSAQCLGQNSAPNSAQGSTEGSVLEFYTENFPPYNYLENGELKGIASSTINELAAEVGEEPEISVMAWPRAFKMAQEKPDRAIFSMVRTPEREDLFQWVGPLQTIRLALYSASSNAERYKGSNAENIELAKQAGTISVQFKGAGYEILTKLGFVNLSPIQDIGESFSLLLNRRHDLMQMSDAYVDYMIEQKHISAGEITQIAVIGEFDIYLAFSRMTAEVVVERWRQALEVLKKKQTKIEQSSSHPGIGIVEEMLPGSSAQEKAVLYSRVM